ncbi:MAG: hypothetical protein B7X95_08995 [Methylophilaceae bacterium 17-44-8]|nr:MAG: hypothetical protein B7Y48_01895 [Methylophilales bacterium 28-44-11]OZA04761.1 MAG: hypothetical protein B7X95_08995 [Methylophilaceae bacterium 17-44-8]
MFQLILSINNISSKKLKLSILLISILIAAQIQYIQHGWINPDSVLYLEAAKLFAEGQWKSGFNIFQWPFYSLWIAGTHKVSGLNIHHSAQFLNVFFFAISTISFITIISLAGGNKITMAAGALILFSSSYVVGDVLEMLMRDEGFWAFYLTSIVFFIQFYKHQRYQDALLWQLSAIFAMLFRIEAIMYLALLPLILLTNKKLAWTDRIHALIKVNFLNILIALGVATTLTLNKHMTMENFGRLKEIFSTNLGNEFTHNLITRANIMSSEVLGNYLEEFAVPGLLLTFILAIVVKIFSAAGFVNIGLATYTLKCRQVVIDPLVSKILYCVALISLINMALIITKVFVLSTRYVVGLGFIIMLFASFSFAYLLSQHTNDVGTNDKKTRVKKWLIYAMMIFMVLGVVKNILPKREGYNYLQEAASWVANNNPQHSPVFFDDLRVQYYAGAPYKSLGGDGWELFQDHINSKKINEYNMLVLSISPKYPERNLYITQHLTHYELMKKFKNYNGKKLIHIYQRKKGDETLS